MSKLQATPVTPTVPAGCLLKASGVSGNSSCLSFEHVLKQAEKGIGKNEHTENKHLKNVDPPNHQSLMRADLRSHSHKPLVPHSVNPHTAHRRMVYSRESGKHHANIGLYKYYGNSHKIQNHYSNNFRWHGHHRLRNITVISFCCCSWVQRPDIVPSVYELKEEALMASKAIEEALKASKAISLPNVLTQTFTQPKVNFFQLHFRFPFLNKGAFNASSK